MVARSDKATYGAIAATWTAHHLRRALTRADAERLARALYARFGRRSREYPSQF